MVSQLRIYTINRGMMDSWLKVFEERIRPLHEQKGIPIEVTWVNAARTEFIWVRSFESEGDSHRQDRSPVGPSGAHHCVSDIDTSPISACSLR